MASLNDAILEILSLGVPLKAKDIAARLAGRGFPGIDPSQVNAVLYGELGGHVRQDRQYRWALADAAKAGQGPQPSSDASEQPRTLLGRLCSYYIDCLYADGMGDLSVFAQSRGQPNFVELGSGPELTEDSAAGADRLAGVAGIRDLFAAQQRDRNRTTLYYGYPVFLRWLRSRRSNWEGAKLEPLIVCRLEKSDAEGRGNWHLTDDWPQINAGVLKEFIESREELRQLLEDLGLMEAEGESPSFGDIALRLADLLPDLPWKESINPNSCQEAPPLSEITEPGFYNRGIILLGSRSQYTAGLETELGKLGQLPPASTQGTALGHILGEPQPTGHVAIPPGHLFEAIPLNDEQRAAVHSAMTAPFTVITGPPGTGKSQVVTSILVNAALGGRRVLFASKNNKAVDVVLERANGLTSRPILIRLGSGDEHRELLLSFLSNLLSTNATSSDETAMKEAEADYRSLLKQREENQQKIDDVVAIRNCVDQLERQVDCARKDWSMEVFQSCLAGNKPVSPNAANQFGAAVEKCAKTISGFCGYIRWLLFRNGLLSQVNSALAACCAEAETVRLTLPPFAQATSNLSVYRKAAESLRSQARMGALVAEYGKALSQLRGAPSIPALSVRDAELSEMIADAATIYLAAWSQCLPSRLDQESRRSLSRYRAALQSLTGEGLSRQELARLFREIEDSFKVISKFLSCWCVTNLTARGRLPFMGGYFDLVVICNAPQKLDRWLS